MNTVEKSSNKAGCAAGAILFMFGAWAMDITLQPIVIVVMVAAILRWAWTD